MPNTWVLDHAVQGEYWIKKAMDLEATQGSHEEEVAAFALIAIGHFLAATITPAPVVTPGASGGTVV